MIMTQKDCCPKFDPLPWDDKMLHWQDKRFIKNKVFTLFHIPINFGQVMKRLDAKVRKSGGTMPDFLCLSDHTSKWQMDVYLAVDKEIQDAENVIMTADLYSKVYEGPFKDTGKWCKDFESLVKSKGKAIKKWLMWYTTCPKCAKKYGKNYVVLLAET